MTSNTIQMTDQLWESVLDVIRKKVSMPAYDTWFAPLKAEEEEGHRLVLTAPNEFSKEWINERYKIEILEVLNKLTGFEYLLKVVSPEDKQASKKMIMYGGEALGYMLLSCRDAGLPPELVKQLHNNMLSKFESYTSKEAESKGMSWFRAIINN